MALVTEEGNQDLTQYAVLMGLGVLLCAAALEAQARRPAERPSPLLALPAPLPEEPPLDWERLLPPANRASRGEVLLLHVLLLFVAAGVALAAVTFLGQPL